MFVFIIYAIASTQPQPQTLQPTLIVTDTVTCEVRPLQQGYGNVRVCEYTVTRTRRQ